jgi:hypothetical protein
MRKTTKPFPTFESEAEERRFWESRDSAIAWTGAGPSACGCPALYLSVAKLAWPGELGGGREPVCAWGERARD